MAAEHPNISRSIFTTQSCKFRITTNEVVIGHDRAAQSGVTLRSILWVGALRLEKHPDKTFIGRIEKGFDFLGFHFSRDGLSSSAASVPRRDLAVQRLPLQETQENGMEGILL